MDSPLVSILIPNYNKAPYLRETLDSVLAQTYNNWECIIVDDHSTDNSWEILEQFASIDSRIKISKRPKNRKNGGNAARNYAIQNAKGEFIALLDSDDKWYPNRLENALSYLKSKNYQAIFSGAMVFDGKTIKKFKSRDFELNESVFDFVVKEDSFSPTPTLVLKTEIAKGILFDENLKRHQDYDFFIRVHQTTQWMYFENYEVEIDWSRPNIHKKDFVACIPFYEKHSRLSIDPTVRYNYIRRITSLAARKNPSRNVSFYFYKVLRSENYSFSIKEIILFRFPFLFSILSKLNSLLK